MNNAVDLSIIVVSHGHDAMLTMCIESALTGAAGLTTEVVLVDNLQDGRVRDIVGGLSKRPTLIENDVPLGFAANVNLGVSAAHGRLLLILNPDTQLTSGRLADACSYLEGRPEIGLLGCRLLNRDGSIQQNYREFPTIPFFMARILGADGWKRPPRFYRRGLMSDVRCDEPHCVDWVFGAFMLMRRSDFQRVGGMDQGFHLYYEDVDLCFRLRAAGLLTYLFPRVAFLHEHLRTSAAEPLGRHWRWHVQSAFRYFRKAGREAFVHRPLQRSMDQHRRNNQDMKRTGGL